MIRRYVLVWLSFWVCDVNAAESPVSFPACADYHCEIRKQVKIYPAEWSQIKVILSNATSAIKERQQIRTAIALMEELAGRQTGTWMDKARNSGDSTEFGQLDCIAESINTTTYLSLIEKDDLLRWHRVEDRQQRNPSWFSYHWTAVIKERISKQRYAVDSWYLANAEPPAVMPLELWLQGQNPE